MKCIIVDDEPLAREAVMLLINETKGLELLNTFNNAISAEEYLKDNEVDLIFLDIQMPHITGIDFARNIPKTTLVIFTTAYTEFAIDSYEVDAIDYLIKPIELERFQRAVEKAKSYHLLLMAEEKEDIQEIKNDFIFVKSDRRFYKVNFNDIYFIEGLKDYVIIQLKENRLITKMNLKAIHQQLPKSIFMRVNKSYIVNSEYIDSFDNNDIYISKYEIPIGTSYREYFFEEYLNKNI